MEIEFVGDKTVHIAPGQTILEASLSAGIPHFHACGGQAKCSTCQVMVVHGADNLNKPNDKEEKLKGRVGLPERVRLACQTTVKEGDVKVDRVVKDNMDVSVLVHPDEEHEGQFKLLPLGREQNLVLFFLDLRHFTPFVESHLPFDVIYMIRRLFTSFYDIIVQHGGEVVETAGDEVFAVFGLKTSVKEAADAAIATGHAILKQLEISNCTYREIFQRDFNVGIGIHCGRVVVGEVKLGQMVKLHTVGLPVNVASRIQEATKELNNSFLASDELISRSSHLADTEKRTVTLDGVTTPMTVHLLGKAYTEA